MGVAGLKQATREILELLTPPELLELPGRGGATRMEDSHDSKAQISPSSHSTAHQDLSDDIPLLPSAIPDESEAQVTTTWGAPRASNSQDSRGTVPPGSTLLVESLTPYDSRR